MRIGPVVRAHAFRRAPAVGRATLGIRAPLPHACFLWSSDLLATPIRCTATGPEPPKTPGGTAPPQAGRAGQRVAPAIPPAPESTVDEIKELFRHYAFASKSLWRDFKVGDARRGARVRQSRCARARLRQEGRRIVQEVKEKGVHPALAALTRGPTRPELRRSGRHEPHATPGGHDRPDHDGHNHRYRTHTHTHARAR